MCDVSGSMSASAAPKAWAQSFPSCFLGCDEDCVGGFQIKGLPSRGVALFIMCAILFQGIQRAPYSQKLPCRGISGDHAEMTALGRSGLP